MNDSHSQCKKREPGLVRMVQGCQVRLFFASEDNCDALQLSQSMLSTSYAKKILSLKSAALIDSGKQEWNNNSRG